MIDHRNSVLAFRCRLGFLESLDDVAVISAKRDREELSDAQIDWVIDAYTRGVVAEEQMSALAMAIYLKSLSTTEAAVYASNEDIFTYVPGQYQYTIGNYDAGTFAGTVTSSAPSSARIR